MSETVLPSEAISPKQRILEVGFGTKPAFKHGGTLFSNSDLEYAGIEFLPGLCQFEGTLAASIGHIPFKDNTFDYVMMRSVFGMFKDLPHYPPEPFDFEEVADDGMRESFRVLKPGGQIAILEENTPWNIRYVKAYLERVGFQIKDSEVMNNDWEKLGRRSKWKKLREPFFNTEPTMGFGSVYFDDPYIVIGEKPIA